LRWVAAQQFNIRYGTVTRYVRRLTTLAQSQPKSIDIGQKMANFYYNQTIK
jgi:hypothetical protein